VKDRAARPITQGMAEDPAAGLERRDARRRRAMAQGGWWGLGTMGVALPYALLSDGPHRGALLAVAAAGFAMSVLLGVAASLRLVGGALHKPVMLAYSTAHIVVVAALAVADGGADSPMALGFFGTFTFVAYTMPPRLLATFGGLNVAAYLGVYAVAGAARPAFVPVQLAGMIATASACAMQHNMLVRQRRRMASLARTDPLTGCLNRRGFQERLDGELSAAVGDGSGLAVLLIDLDDFKAINDRDGHAAGDRLLVAAADAMRAAVGGMTLGRLGGDEFAVILRPADGDAAEAAAGAVSAGLAAHVSASIGTALLGADGTTAETLVAAADRRMYAQKQRGRVGRAA
jgi:diguanylate cyclase (GGDEF)-like protein